MIEELIPYIGQVLLMTVSPGFGGQSFIETMPGKIEKLREMIAHLNPECVIQVDGGINTNTVGRVVKAGATSIVAGSAVINRDASITENLAKLRAAIEG
jgi:ribulose-phosphate 3-epimerase